MDTALALGLTAFDLTPYSTVAGSYGDLVGQAVAAAQHARWDVVVSVRIGRATGPGPRTGYGSRKYLLSTLDALLHRTGLGHVDLLFAHGYDPHTPLEETTAALADAVQQGKALYPGLSGYAPAPLTRAANLLRERGTPAVACQLPYSLLNRWAEDATIDTLTRHDIGAIACAPLSHGDLAHTTPPHFPPTAPVQPCPLRTLAAARGQTPAQLALSWTLHTPAIASALITTTQATHLAENSRASHHTTFTPTELATLDACHPPPERP
ncbi:aldo/keto reductase [Streptomyces sp. NPDC057743]|uniref:aldo/keto reductase n=1 Tax=Streptomyces sp. NPDC057743 TaxID=3346236 RepID=UPI00369B5040